MIQLYFDKIFINYFIDEFNYNDDHWNDFASFLRGLGNPLEIYSNLPVLDFEKVQPLFLLLNHSNTPRYFFVNDISDLLTDSFLKNKVVFKLFFTGLPLEIAKKNTDRHGYTFFSREDFEYNWGFYITGNNRTIIKQSISREGFCSWDSLSEFKHPTDTIIIHDSYILNDKDLIETNLVKILKAFCFSFSSDNKIKVFVITNNNKKFNNSRWENCFTQILNSLKNNKLEFNLILYPPNLPHHFRAIFTNYWYIQPGNSMVFFDKNGKLKNGISDNISFDLNFYKRTQKILKERLLDVERYFIETAKDSNSIGTQDAEKRRYLSSSISNDFLPDLILSIKL
jgi:hypothetical protein